MKSKSARIIFGLGAFVVVSVFILNTLAMRFYWYWAFPWFDIMMHGLGGIFLGIMAGWMLSIKQKTNWIHYIFFGIIMAFVVGFGWELLEGGLDMINGSHLQPDRLDTITDLLSDSIGGIVGGLFAWKINYFYGRK
ncbi:MAG: hypothetical protein OEX08_03575 [Candidatus Nomurabacteria bacterium]|nr:hypothetical protein [Candidatus Nomurabacteria bacterium]